MCVLNISRLLLQSIFFTIIADSQRSNFCIKKKQDADGLHLNICEINYFQ